MTIAIASSVPSLSLSLLAMPEESLTPRGAVQRAMIPFNLQMARMQPMHRQ